MSNRKPGQISPSHCAGYNRNPTQINKYINQMPTNRDINRQLRAFKKIVKRGKKNV